MNNEADTSRPEPQTAVEPGHQLWRIRQSTAATLALIIAAIIGLNILSAFRKLELPRAWMDTAPGAMWIGGDKWSTSASTGWPLAFHCEFSRSFWIGVIDAAFAALIVLVVVVVSEWWVRHPAMRRTKSIVFAAATFIALASAIMVVEAERLPLDLFGNPVSTAPPPSGIIINNGTSYGDIIDWRKVAMVVARDLVIVSLFLLGSLLLCERAIRRGLQPFMAPRGIWQIDLGSAMLLMLAAGGVIALNVAIYKRMETMNDKVFIPLVFFELLLLILLAVFLRRRDVRGKTP